MLAWAALQSVLLRTTVHGTHLLLSTLYMRFLASSGDQKFDCSLSFS